MLITLYLKQNKSFNYQNYLKKDSCALRSNIEQLN